MHAIFLQIDVCVRAGILSTTRECFQTARSAHALVAGPPSAATIAALMAPPGAAPTISSLVIGTPATTAPGHRCCCTDTEAGISARCFAERKCRTGVLQSSAWRGKTVLRTLGGQRMPRRCQTFKNEHVAALMYTAVNQGYTEGRCSVSDCVAAVW